MRGDRIVSNIYRQKILQSNNLFNGFHFLPLYRIMQQTNDDFNEVDAEQQQQRRLCVPLVFFQQSSCPTAYNSIHSWWMMIFFSASPTRKKMIKYIHLKFICNNVYVNWIDLHGSKFFLPARGSYINPKGKNTFSSIESELPWTGTSTTELTFLYLDYEDTSNNLSFICSLQIWNCLMN